MRPGGGKSKGAAYEREICRDLSLWISDGKQQDCFWRSAISGGRTTVWRKKGVGLNAQAGDISCIHPAGHMFADLYFVEVKFYANLNFEGLITGKGHLIQVWQQARKQANEAKKTPLLIARQNRAKAIACLAYSGAEQLSLKNYTLACVPSLNLRIITWADFLEHAVKPT
jgi:hypothetical protein